MWNNNTIEDEIQRNSLEYGVSVNTDRSIPDAKSGLKPVARRIIYDAFIEGRLSNKPHVKSARIVGDVMGRLHPHGDSSIYGAMMRLSQNWVMRYPLIDVHGNNGNVLGDGPAAQRYTESRLSAITEEGLLSGLKKRNVDFIPNYDESEEEPVTLPAIFPNLLCNPNEGIGWAMGCSWAPHNLNEVKDAIIDYLNDKEPMLPGPDFPTGGIIINKNDIPAIMRTGHGSVKVRGRYRIDGNNIIFYEIPYGTRVEPLMEEIGKASEDGNIDGIVDVRNETGKKEGLKLTIQVDKKFSPETVVAQLFNKTSLQSSFSYNQVALVGKTPTEMNLKDAIGVYVNHNIDCIKREAQFDLDKAAARQHIVEGLLKALEDIDNVIALIKKSESAAMAKEKLMEKYNFSEAQTKAILDMRLAKLANLEKVELNEEAQELNNQIQSLTMLLNNRAKQVEELITRLAEITKKYGDKRRTELIQIDAPKNNEPDVSTITAEPIVVVLTNGGTIKRIPKDSFKPQNRNGKGVKFGDVVRDVITTNTQDNLLLFTNEGRMHRIIANNLPVGTNTSRGIAIRDLINLSANEEVIAITNIERANRPKHIVFFTAQGTVKKSKLEDYITGARKGSIQAIKLRDGDSIVNIQLMDEEEALLISKLGRCIRISTNDIAPTGRITIGVRGMLLEKDDEVIAAMPIKDNNAKVIIVGTDGQGKRVAINEFACQARNGKGVLCYPDMVADAMVSADNDNILIVGSPNSITIACSDIPLFGRQAKGNILINGSKVIAITNV